MDLAGMVVVGLLFGVLYGLVASGFAIVYKSTGIINFAQGAIALVAAYVFWQFYVDWSLPLWLGLLIAIVISALLGWITERACVRYLVGQPHIALVLVTLVLFVLLSNIVHAIWGPVVKESAPLLSGVGVMLGPIAISPSYFLSFGIAVVLTLGLIALYKFTKLGLGMRGVAESHILAQSVGINVSAIFSLSWLLAGAIGGLAGVFLASVTSTSLALSHVVFKGLSAVILGGMDSIPGALIGGLIVGVVEFLSVGILRMFTPTFAGFGDVMPFVLIVLILLIRPYGIFGQVQIERV